MIRSSLALLLLCAFFALVGGCALADADIRVEGDFAIEECGQFFPWEPTIAGFTRSNDFGVMRFYEFEGRPPTLNNSFVLTIRDMDEFRSSIGSPIPVTIGLDDEPAGIADASLSYAEFCGGDDQFSGDDVEEYRAIPALFVGSVTFNRFGLSDGDRIEGTLEGELRDGRDPESVVGSGITGTFSFLYRVDRPYQPFPVRE